jgi:light-regulated signal transduction histidine kinase (bacteriophytochrome)
LAVLAVLVAAALGAALWRRLRRPREREAALRRSHQILEERVAERTAELEQTVRELDDFAHVVAHDLREPLRGIHNLAGFLADDLGDRIDPEHRSMLETLGRLSRRMDEQIQVIHRFARVGREGMNIAPTDLNRMLEAVRESLQVLLTERNGELRVGPLPTIPCDPVLVQDLFRNLVANGLKYNESPVPRVEVAASEGETCAVFTVRDNGLGIPFDRQEEIFTIFRRLHPADAYGGGTGAGLAIARRIVRRHGGWIWLESVPGDGTTFFFTLEGYCEHRDGPPAHFDR